MFDIRRLEALVAVCETGSVSGAAQLLGLSQPAVSHQLNRLELEAGTALLLRRSRGMQPTAAGELLLAHARAVLGRLEAARRDLDDLVGLRSGRVRASAFPTACIDLLPQAIRQVRGQTPGVEVAFAAASREQALRDLAGDEVDLAVIFDGPPAPEAVHLMDDTMLAVLPRSHRLAGARTVSLSMLAEEPWVMGSGEIIDRALAAAGIRPASVVRSDDLLAVQGIVAAGLGVSLAPALALAHKRPDVVLRPLTAPITRRIDAILRPGAPPGARALLSALVEVAATLG